MAEFYINDPEVVKAFKHLETRIEDAIVQMNDHINISQSYYLALCEVLELSMDQGLDLTNLQKKHYKKLCEMRKAEQQSQDTAKSNQT